MKRTFVALLIFFILALAACSAAGAQANSSTTAAGNGANDPGNAPLPPATELMLGTFKLEGTDQAVTADEAAQLLPLWLVYKDLTSSSSAAQEEIDALADQIKTTMTAGQIQSITDMKLTRRDLFQIMTDLGIVPAGGTRGSGTPRPNNGQGGPGGGPGGMGGPDFGGPPGGGGGGGQNFTPAQIATAQAGRAQGGSGFANRIPSALYDALIKLLQDKK